MSTSRVMTTLGSGRGDFRGDRGVNRRDLLAGALLLLPCAPMSCPIPARPSFVAFNLADTEGSIPSRFEHIAGRYATRVAVHQGRTTWTYRQLQAEVERIAGAVVEAVGLAPEPVAVLGGQTPTLLAAILGVLKAGHFYVPLDPSHPAAASASILEDCGSRLILTDSASYHVAHAIPSPAEILNVELLPAADERAPFGAIAPQALACIYYTSGSTGRPKGVMDTHRNVLHNVLRYTNGLKISPEDRLSLVQSPTFSGVMSSQFGALLNGAAIFPYDIAADGIAAIGPWLRRERITIYHSVPAIYRQFAAAGAEPQQFPDIRIVRLEGDGATPRDVEIFREHFPPDAVLSHGLGATECGLVRRYSIGHGGRFSGAIVPVGYAVDDTVVRLLDDSGQEVADGDVGEIVVESAYLSPGYWKRPDLTSSAFSVGTRADTWLYRTGDIGRFRADGCLEHLGRKDRQPKVRGVRVDVEGIEAAILATGLAREAAVIVCPTQADARLVAYVVPHPDRACTTSMLRRELARVLPPQMLPARFVTVDTLPVTSSHKIDRAALPLPSADRPPLDVPFVEPRTAVETVVAAAWRAALDIERVGIHDDFFDLGGDSLDAVAIWSAVSRAVGADLSTVSVFEWPTVQQFARAVENRVSSQTTGGAPSPLVRFKSSGTRQPFFFLHAEYGGDGSYCWNVARYIGVDRPFFGLSPFGRNDEAVPASVEAMAAAYVSLLRAEQGHGPYTIGGFCSGAVVAWEMAQQLRAAGEEVALLVLIEPPAFDNGWMARLIHAAASCLTAGWGSPDDRVRWVQRLTRAANLEAIPGSGALRRLFAPLNGAESHPPAGEGSEAIAAQYKRAVAAYLPRPFEGRVLCLRANHADDGHAADRWRALATDVTMRTIPGDHNSCIVTHARTLGLTLTAALE